MIADATASIGHRPPFPDLSISMPPVMKVLLPVAVIILVLLKARSWRLDPLDDVGLRRPSLGPAVVWIVGYAIYFVGSDALMHWRGPWDFTVWRQQTLWTSAFRVAGVGILGPVAEELLFRGVFYGKLRRMNWSTPATIVLLGVAWGVLHASYGVSVTLLIIGGGILLGTARATTRSVLVPVLMHITWNLYAVW